MHLVVGLDEVALVLGLGLGLLGLALVARVERVDGLGGLALRALDLGERVRVGLGRELELGVAEAALVEPGLGGGGGELRLVRRSSTARSPGRASCPCR